VYASATTYKVDVQLNGDGISMNSTAWILRNGTALAVDELGNNETGAAGQQLVGNLFAGFTAEIQAGSELSQYTASPGFHSDGNSTVTLGPSTFTVTNYVANSLPLTEAACGATTVITSFNLSVGEPQGSGYELVTFIQFDASVTGSGIPTSAVGYVIQIVSVTVASQAGG